jgi:NNP family nitrate/nitrite transporter-like MFS transporter
MRAFHMAWLALFLCFFAWFAVAPLMTVIRGELGLTREQVGWCIIGSVSITVVARLLVGWLCDRLGPRLTYSGLLVIGSLPVMGIGLAHDFSTFLLFRGLIGGIGASFVVTQYHASLMFAPGCVGTANATAAGWGNLGGGATQIAMPLLLAGCVALGLSDAAGWRAAMLVVGALCAAAGVAYFFLTQDTPAGNFAELRSAGVLPAAPAAAGSFLAAGRDRRVWALAIVYGCCFGVELTFDNIAVLYFLDHFEHFRRLAPGQALQQAGLLAGLFGGMNLFARALGGIISDRCQSRWGLAGRVQWLFLAVLGEGLSLMLFAQATTLARAVPAMLLLALFVKMANGATYAVVPFINRRALGSVSGIVGAGGNVGAVATGFLFKANGLSWPTALFILGAAVTCGSFLAFAVKFPAAAERESRGAADSAIAIRRLTTESVAASA